MNRLFSLIFLLVIIVSACKHDEIKSKAALVCNDTIYMDEVDNIIKHQLYDELMKIHSIRKNAINAIIKDKLIETEAIKNQITPEQLIQEKIERKITDLSLQKYIKNNMIEGRVPSLKGGILRYVPINSAEGQNIIVENYRNQLTITYIDSLKKVYNVTIFLQEPKTLQTNISNIEGYYKGNLKSKVTLMIITDFDCLKCREADTLFEKIYDKYNSKIRFGNAIFTDGVSYSSLAAECAGLQGKFWEMKDKIFESDYFADPSVFISYAKDLDIDITRFSNNFNDSLIVRSLEKNANNIRNAGFYGTPSVVVNKQVISNVFSENDIIQAIEKELAK